MMIEGQSVTAKTLLNFRISQLTTHPDILVLTVVTEDGELSLALDQRIALGLSKHVAEFAAKLPAPLHEH